MDAVEPLADDALAELDREVDRSSYVSLGEYQWRALRARLDAADAGLAEAYAKGSADRWTCAEEHFNGSGECGPDSWDCRCPNPHRKARP